MSAAPLATAEAARLAAAPDMPAAPRAAADEQPQTAQRHGDALLAEVSRRRALDFTATTFAHAKNAGPALNTVEKCCPAEATP